MYLRLFNSKKPEIILQNGPQCQRIKAARPRLKVLFLSPAENAYIPGTIIARAFTPCSYYIEAQGKRYYRIRKHIRPIQKDIFVYPIPQLQHWVPKPSPIPKCSHSIKPFISARAHPQTPEFISTKPKPLASTTNSHICRPQQLRASQPNPHLCPLTPPWYQLINLCIT